MEDQVWKWLWEYCVKFKYSDICQEVEQYFSRKNVFPEFKSNSLFLFVRQMQQISYSSLQSQQELKKLTQVLEDILAMKKLHFHIKFHKEIIKTYVSAKMLISAGDGHRTFKKEVSKKYWKSIKKKFAYNDDDYRKSYEEGYIVANEALENGLNTQLQNRTLKLLREALSLLESTFRFMLPTSALEKLCNNDVRECFEQQEEVPVYGVLLKATKSGITKKAVMSIFQWLRKENMFVVKTKYTKDTTGKKKKSQVSSESGEDDTDHTLKLQVTSKLSRNRKNKRKYAIEEVFDNTIDIHNIVIIAGKEIKVAEAPLIMTRRSETSNPISKAGKSLYTKYENSEAPFSQNQENLRSYSQPRVDNDTLHSSWDLVLLEGKNRNIKNADQANLKSDNQLSDDNDILNSSWNLVLLGGKNRKIKNADLVKIKSSVYKTIEKLRAESKNSTESIDMPIPLSEKQSVEDSEIQDLEMLIHLVGDYIDKLKINLNNLKQKRNKERHKSLNTDIQKNSIVCNTRISIKPNNDTFNVKVNEKGIKCGNKELNIAQKSSIFIEKDVHIEMIDELSKDIGRQEISTCTKINSDDTESTNYIKFINRNKSFSTIFNEFVSKDHLLFDSESVKPKGIRGNDLNETNDQLNKQKNVKNYSKPLSIEDAKRKIKFNSNEKEDEIPSNKEEPQDETVETSIPVSITEDDIEEEEESLHLEMSFSASPKGDLPEKDELNSLKDVDKDTLIDINVDNHKNSIRKQTESHDSILEDFSFSSQSKKKCNTEIETNNKKITTEDSEEGPLVCSKQSFVFESLSSEKQVESQFYSVQEDSKINIVHEDLESNLCQNVVSEPLIVLNGKTEDKKGIIHSDMIMTKENMVETYLSLTDINDLATCVKTSPRKRKSNISEYESDSYLLKSEKEARSHSQISKKLKGTNISTSLPFSESKTATNEKSKHNSVGKPMLPEEDNSSEVSEDFFTPDGSPVNKSESLMTKVGPNKESVVSPPRLSARLQHPTEFITVDRDEVAVRLTKTYTKKYQNVKYNIFA